LLSEKYFSDFSSCFFWLPAHLEKNYLLHCYFLHHEAGFSLRFIVQKKGYADFSSHFPLNSENEITVQSR